MKSVRDRAFWNTLPPEAKARLMPALLAIAMQRLQFKRAMRQLRQAHDRRYHDGKPCPGDCGNYNDFGCP